MLVELPITDGFYVSRALPLASQSCINWYPTEIVLSTGEVLRVSLFGTPGLNQLATSGILNEQNRGSWVLEGVPYFVNGTTLYRLESDLVTLTGLGTITGTSRVSMSDNGTQLFILVPGSTGYIFTTGPDTLTTITDGDFTANGNPQAVVFMDGYFVLSTDTKKFIISALNNGLAYNALDFGSAEYDPDAIVAPFVFKSQLFMLGTETTEVFSNIGGSAFPFQRQQGFILSKGLSAKDSIANSQDTFMWVGAGKNEGPAIWSLQGNTTVKVSTTAIDSILEREAEAGLLPDVFSFNYSQDGAYFVGWTLSNTTIVYDTQSRRWHERKSDISNVKTRWRANSLVQAYGKILVGDFIDGRVGELDLDILTEYGDIIERVISTRPFTAQGMPFTVPFIELTVESGVGNVNAPDPKMRMDRSTNAKIFTDERPRSIGKVGEYDQRVVWRRNGRAARFEVFRWSFAENARAVIAKAEADVRVLRA